MPIVTADQCRRVMRPNRDKPASDLSQRFAQLLEHVLEEGEALRLIARDAQVTRSLHSGFLVVTSRRLLFYKRRDVLSGNLTDVAPSLDLTRSEISVGNRLSTGIRIMTPSRKKLELRTGPGPGGLELADAVEYLVLGPSGEAGGSPDDRLAIGRCVYLGGYGTEMVEGAMYNLRFDGRSIQVRDAGRARVVGALDDVIELELSGPGRYSSGGGFIGGGFGLKGAAEGMGIAALLNSLTTTSGVSTVVRIKTRDAEVFLHHDRRTPEDLRIYLSEFLAELGTASAATDQPTAKPDAIDRLAKLAQLRDQGALTADEFAAAKAKLLQEL